MICLLNFDLAAWGVAIGWFLGFTAHRVYSNMG